MARRIRTTSGKGKFWIEQSWLDYTGTKFARLPDRRVERDTLESSWCNREQYLLVDVLEDRHDNEPTNGKEEGSCERKQ